MLRIEKTIYNVTISFSMHLLILLHTMNSFYRKHTYKKKKSGSVLPDLFTISTL